jgi:hypothetical protein
MPKYSRSKRLSKRMKGGNGAAEYAEKVYGSAGNQHADPAGGNVIAMNRVTGGKKQEQQGGKILTDIALPAVLVVANHTLGRKQPVRNTKKFYRKNRRSNRFRRSMRR